MSTPTWLTINKQSGSGNDQITVTASSENTGKTARRAIVSGSATNGASDETVVTQSAKALFVAFNQAAYSINAGVLLITVSGKTNATSLQFSLASGSHFEIPSTMSYVVAGEVNARTTSINKNTGVATPSGDPGATAEYDFSLTLMCPANTSAVSSVTDTLTVIADNDGNVTSSCTLTHATASSTLEMTSAVTLGQAAGSTAQIVITSNDGWTIDVSE